jgi:hypothetical protein
MFASGAERHDIQHNGTQCRMLLRWASFMLSVANKPIMPCVIMLNVVMAIVVAPKLSIKFFLQHSA